METMKMLQGMTMEEREKMYNDVLEGVRKQGIVKELQDEARKLYDMKKYYDSIAFTVNWFLVEKNKDTEALLEISKSIACSTLYRLYLETGYKSFYYRSIDCLCLVNDGYDCVMEAFTYLYEHCIVGNDDMKTPFKHEKKVVKTYKGIVVSEKTVEEETTHFIEACRKVRRFVRSLRTLQSNDYMLSVEQIIEEGKEGMLSSVHDIQHFTPNKYDVKRALKLALASMNLSESQIEIARMRLERKGEKAIAKALNISQTRVKQQLKTMQKKAIKAGLWKEEEEEG